MLSCFQWVPTLFRTDQKAGSLAEPASEVLRCVESTLSNHLAENLATSFIKWKKSAKSPELHILGDERGTALVECGRGTALAECGRHGSRRATRHQP